MPYHIDFKGILISCDSPDEAEKLAEVVKKEGQRASLDEPKEALAVVSE